LGEDVDAYFGRLGRDGVDEIQSASRLVLGVPLLQEIINAMPVPVSVMNEKGQVILTNRCWDRSVGEGADCLLGKRHGELLGCMRCEDGPEGCGTSAGCAGCGAAVSILNSQQSQEQVTCEYRLYRRTPKGPELEELMVTTTPIEVDGRGFSIFVLHVVDPLVAVKSFDL
jgi:PAS domain-containing protein